MSPSLALKAEDIHVWLVDYSTIDDESLKSEYRSLLSGAERAQEPRFHFEKDRLRYLVTRALARVVLSKYTEVSPQGWTFALNSYGRPEIANTVPMKGRLSFNISHTRSLIVLGVSLDRELGVDVENVSAREAPIKIADRYFSPAEVAALTRVSPAGRPDRFFEYWTFKESYIKARGMGLSLPLEKFSFHFPHDGRVELEIDPELQDSPARWEFWQLRPTAEHLVAVCAESLQSRSSLTIRRVVPLRSEEVLNLSASRRSIGRT